MMRSGRPGWGFWSRAGSAALLALAGSASFWTVQAKSDASLSALAPQVTIAATQLPPQGQAMMTLIYQGGPFKYDKDGTVFGNREKQLPVQPRGFYREYTVKTPGVRSRGARRIVCGGQRPVVPDACYYTDDHYASFRRIVH